MACVFEYKPYVFSNAAKPKNYLLHKRQTAPRIFGNGGCFFVRGAYGRFFAALPKQVIVKTTTGNAKKWLTLRS